MLICWNGVAYKVLIKTRSAMNHLDTVIFPTVCVEYARFQRDWHDTNDPCPFPFIFAARSVYETPQITALVDPRCSNPQENCEGLYGEPCQLPWGANDLPDLPLLTPVVAPQWEKICLCLLLLLPPTSGTEDESYLSILFPGAGRPCLFILIGSICGTAVASRGWRWQRFVHAFPWQQYSWQARQQAARTRLINTNNEAANQE